MPATILSIEVPEAVLAECELALCRYAGLPVTGANAKAALITFVRNLVVEEQRERKLEEARAAQISPPEGLK